MTYVLYILTPTCPSITHHRVVQVSVRVDGYAARDIAKNFIQRWNHHRNDIQMVSPLLIPKTILWAHSDTKNCQVCLPHLPPFTFSCNLY